MTRTTRLGAVLLTAATLAFSGCHTTVIQPVQHDAPPPHYDHDHPQPPPDHHDDRR